MSQDNDVVKQIVRWLQADSRRNRMHKYLREQERYENPFYERRLSEHLESKEQAPVNLTIVDTKMNLGLKARLRAIAFVLMISATYVHIIAVMSYHQWVKIQSSQIDYGVIDAIGGLTIQVDANATRALNSVNLWLIGGGVLLTSYMLSLGAAHALFWMAHNVKESRRQPPRPQPDINDIDHYRRDRGQ